ncbi:MAG TPA: protein-methionine-sulfoxide reductase catalytic subunit MsrP, partial [Methylomirabilota bacterium]|nr:protein-methionine-sulfoxide reductase catalytic subunit MsrP [Methylomirabilota bacterium]
MLIRVPGPNDPRPSEITPRGVYVNRRVFMAGAAAAAAATVAGCGGETEAALKPAVRGQSLTAARNQALSVADPPTPWDSATTYNNFYEFGTDKADPALHAHTLRPRPWSVEVGGLCHKPKTFDIEEILRLAPLEERVYVLRCVEGWSMVIPWIGYPLSALLRRVEPTGAAKYVEFQTLVDPEQMPGTKPSFFGSSLDWPYVEGLRLDEATHPLTLLTVGMYGHVLPSQNGAPIRIVVPWKYGFKSAKSLVR